MSARPPEEWALRCAQSQRRSDQRRARRAWPTAAEVRADLGAFAGLLLFLGACAALLVMLGGPPR